MQCTVYHFEIRLIRIYFLYELNIFGKSVNTDLRNFIIIADFINLISPRFISIAIKTVFKQGQINCTYSTLLSEV